MRSRSSVMRGPLPIMARLISPCSRRTRRRGSGFENLILFHQIRVLDGALDGDQQHIAAERLGDVVVRAELHRLDCGFDRAVGSHEDDGKLLIALANFIDQFQAVHAGHLEIGDDGIE
jgi:hypothetical protein